MLMSRIFAQMFDNLCALRLETNEVGAVIVTAMISCEKEIMPFRNNQNTGLRVELWMVDVEAEMRRSNRYITKFAVHNYGTVVRPR